MTEENGFRLWFWPMMVLSIAILGYIHSFLRPVPIPAERRLPPVAAACYHPDKSPNSRRMIIWQGSGGWNDDAWHIPDMICNYPQDGLSNWRAK
jgi:hypothetical protein